MRDITHKVETRREARAETFLKIPGDAKVLLEQAKSDKGDALEVARAAGILAVKKTWELIPLCHPIPITHVATNYEFEDSGIKIEVSVTSVATTGVEMEALTGASITALTIYDMLKPYEKEIEIAHTRLVEKRGGKSDYVEEISPPVKTSVIVMSDSVSAGHKIDSAGKAVLAGLETDSNVKISGYEILADNGPELAKRIRELISEDIDLIITVGGTGLAHTDITVDTIEPLLDREIPGIMEASRDYGQRRMKYAMLSRGIAGLIGDTLVITMPGSTNGAKETYDALFPQVLHIFQVLRKIPHKHGYGESNNS